MLAYKHTYTNASIHTYLTLHDITLHYITSHYITSHYITVQYITLHTYTYTTHTETHIHTYRHIHTRTGVLHIAMCGFMYAYMLTHRDVETSEAPGTL